MLLGPCVLAAVGRNIIKVELKKGARLWIRLPVEKRAFVNTVMKSGAQCSFSRWAVLSGVDDVTSSLTLVFHFYYVTL